MSALSDLIRETRELALDMAAAVNGRAKVDLSNVTGAVFGGVNVTVDGGTEPIPLSSILSRVLTPQDFGAVGDGVTDDTDALQAMLDACVGDGAPFFLPAGVWTHEGLTIDGRVTGVGAGLGSVLRYAQTSGDGITVSTSDGLGLANMIIEGPSSAGAATSVSGSLLKITAPSGFGNFQSSLTGVEFQYGFDALEFDAAFEWMVRASRFTNTLSTQVSIRNGLALALCRGLLQGIRFVGAGSTGTGIKHTSGNDLRISDSYFTGLQYGYHVEMESGVTLHNVNLSNSEFHLPTAGSRCVYFEKGAGTQFANFQAANNQFYGQYGASDDGLGGWNCDHTYVGNQFFPIDNGFGIDLDINPCVIVGNIFDGGGVSNTTGVRIGANSFHVTEGLNKYTVLTNNYVNNASSEPTVRFMDATFASLISANTFQANQTVRSTDAGSAAGPILRLERASASPAAFDALGALDLYGKDSAGNDTLYGRVAGAIFDPTNGSEDGAVAIQSMKGGALANTVYFAQGGYMEGAAQDPGAGAFAATHLVGNAGLYIGSSTADRSITSGSGTPEGVVTAPVGSLFLRTDGAAATTLYVKTSGAGNTGWTAK